MSSAATAPRFHRARHLLFAGIGLLHGPMAMRSAEVLPLFVETMSWTARIVTLDKLLGLCFVACEVDFFGMSLIGQLRSEEVYRPVAATLVGKIRIGLFGGVVQLIYEVSDLPGERLARMVLDAFDRVRNGRLVQVRLEPTAVHLEELPHIHTDAAVVGDVRFSTGLDLRSGEMVQLFRGKIFVMPGYEFIEPRRPGVFGTVARPYFRDIADDNPSDNLKNLPPFTPQ
jgi:hypothetical protein